jgi:hypothetical protein
MNAGQVSGYEAQHAKALTQAGKSTKLCTAPRRDWRPADLCRFTSEKCTSGLYAA